ncbi:MAG TPA: hypothetical protein VI776_15195 [Anaerolineales bacterium]|nr:hypothetical protein [Anaerolineales bacterium]
MILLLAIGARFYRLGAAPLSDFEAERALQALQVARGEQVALGPGPAYPLLTGTLFSLFDESNFLARLLPALAGSLLVILPLIFVTEIGLVPALVITLGLALDPGLVAISRLAGGPILALSLELLAVGFLLRRRLILAGICAGLALLAGPAAVQGAVILGVTYFAGKWLIRGPDWLPGGHPLEPVSRSDRNKGLVAGGAVVLAAGTLFFLFPQGLSSMAASIPAYLSGWLQPSGIPPMRLVAALIFYNPLVLVFGLLAAGRGWLGGDARIKWLSLWALIALLLTLVYPGRQVSDLVWVLVPLWTMAGIEIVRDLSVEKKDRLPVLGQAALIMILLALAWINLAGVSQSAGDIQSIRLRWAVIGGTVLLGFVTTLLVSLGWTRQIALSGLAWGLVAGLGLFGFANLWNATQVHPNGEQELWYPEPVTGQADLFVKTLGDLSMWRTGMRDTLDITVLSSQPSVRWALRNWPQARYLSGPLPGELPSVIVNTEGQPEPNLSAGYRGQDFAWWVYPAWQGALPPDWARWLVFRAAPQQPVHLILWARADLFPGGVLGPEGGAPAEQEQEAPLDSPTQ